jgi:hypothetical protein
MKAVVVGLLLGFLLSGCVAVEVPTGTPSDRPPPSQGQERSGGDGYTFMHTRDNGQPVRWSTCDPIRYVARPANEPVGARQLLRSSVRRVAEVTGLTFSFEGTTDEAPSVDRRPEHPNRYGDGWSPVLVAYSGPEEYPALKGRTAGHAGPVYLQAGGAPRYVSGIVVLDAEQLRSMDDRAVRAVMLHELAHVVGLGHVEDRGQLMNAVQYGREVLSLQSGDLAGLRALGRGRCYEPVTPR